LDGSFGNTVFDSTITALDVGKTVYVSPTNAGRLTKTKPTTSTDLIQNVGRIINVDGNNVKIAVNNIGRSNDVPNSFSTTGNIDAGSLTVNSDYTFPTTDGSSGQVLVTDGGGNLTFQNQSSTTISISKVADETIAIGDLIRVVQNGESGFIAGRVVKAIDSESKSEELYVATSGATQGNSLTMSMIGELGITFASIPNTTDNGKKAYLSPTSGQATLNAPTSSGTIVVLLGILTGANGVDSTVNVLFRPQFIISN
jgi:hypothetical protein